MPEAWAEERRFVVCGGNALALRLTWELVERHGAAVTVITPGDGVGPAFEPDRLLPGVETGQVTVISATRLTADVFRRAGLDNADGLALVEQDDVGNLDAALIAREVKPGVRIVARMFSRALADGIATILPDVVVLSASEIAAPAFVAAAMGDGVPAYVRLPDRLLRVTRPQDVNPADVLCGLAATAGRRDPELLPDGESADQVLAVAYASPPPPRPRRRRPLRATKLLLGRNLRIVLAVLATVLLLGTIVRSIAGDLGFWPAGYLTVLGAFGGADPQPRASALLQLLDILLVVVGVAVVPALTAAVIEVIVRARLTLVRGGLTDPVSGHVVVVGLGNVGARVVRELHDFGIDVVGVDREENARGVQIARDLGIPVIIGDGRRPETLHAASVETSRTLVVVSVDDLGNLEIALVGRSLHGEATGTALRVVLRLFDEGLADRVTNAFELTDSRSVSYLAAPAFAAALAGPEIIDTIPVGRHVLLVAEIPVGDGSQVDGRPCAEVDRANEVRLIAVRTGRGAQTLWHPPPRRPLVRTDRLVVVATRAGSAALVRRAEGVPDERTGATRWRP